MMLSHVYLRTGNPKEAEEWDTIYFSYYVRKQVQGDEKKEMKFPKLVRVIAGLWTQGWSQRWESAALLLPVWSLGREQE